MPGARGAALDTFDWLGDAATSIWGVINMSQWQSFGYTTMLLTVAMQRIPRELYEAATVDGAGRVRTFFTVTVPMVREMTTLLVILTVSGAFLVFNEVMVMTGGGPSNSSQVLGTWLYDTYWALIVLYTAFKIPFTTFLIRAYLLGQPVEVEEAAFIDGASRWQTFWRVVVPMARPILVSAAVLQSLFSWNEYAFALVFITDDRLKTLPVGLADMAGRLNSDWPMLFAGLTIAALPMIVVFLIGQRHFVRGLSAGVGK
ncbi:MULTISPECIES: ABC transporter permease subunit [unclassified Streptomyces]|uniref:ABC transporter permease n=1 Tax=unclassified Streptomyces TaxID=2593676 RepID=UPI00278C7BC3|nr:MULTISPECIES: ABC transporter permease subunit [unclassified Streptomyces]